MPTLQLGGPCKDHVWAIKGQSFGKFKGQKGATGQASSPQRVYHYSLPPSPIISSAFALLANMKLHILVCSLTNLLSVSLPLEESWKYISISAFALRANAKLYISVHLLTTLLPVSIPIGIKLEISVNINMRTLKFGTKLP